MVVKKVGVKLKTPAVYHTPVRTKPERVVLRVCMVQIFAAAEGGDNGRGASKRYQNRQNLLM